MPQNSKVILGLPNLPSDEIKPRELYPEFLTIYRAIQNLLAGVSRWTGIDDPDDIERAEMAGYEMLLEQNASAWYPTAGENISRGQMVRIAGDGMAYRAQANVASNLAIGVAEETKLVGQNIKVVTQGLTDAITGMSTGIVYYLSPTTPGAVQNLPPITPGQIVQALGWSLDANHFLLRPSTQFRQL